MDFLGMIWSMLFWKFKFVLRGFDVCDFKFNIFGLFFNKKIVYVLKYIIFIFNG